MKFVQLISVSEVINDGSYSSFKFPSSFVPVAIVQMPYDYNTKYIIQYMTKQISLQIRLTQNTLQYKHSKITYCVPFVICPNVLMSKCSFPSPSFVQTFRVTTKKEENHISTEFLRMMEIVKFNIPPSLTSVSTTSLNAKAFKSKLFRRLTFDTRSYLIPAQCMVQHFTFPHFRTCEPQSFQHICRFSRYVQLFQA